MSRKKLTIEQNNFPYLNLGNELKGLRGFKKQKLFAKELGIATQTYNRYEKGRRKIPDGLLKLARILSKNRTVEGVHEASAEYTTSNPISQVIKGIKEIYDSKDIILIQAFTLNIAAFQMAAKLSSEQKKELDELHIICKEILERILLSEQQLKGRILGETKSQEDTGKKVKM